MAQALSCLQTSVLSKEILIYEYRVSQTLSATYFLEGPLGPTVRSSKRGTSDICSCDKSLGEGAEGLIVEETEWLIYRVS